MPPPGVLKLTAMIRLSVPYSQMPSGSQLGVGDLNGDTQDEPAVLSPVGSSWQLSVFKKGVTDLQTVAQWTGTLASPVRLTQGDIDGDARDEVLILNGSGANRSLKVFDLDGSSLVASVLAGGPDPARCQIGTADVLGTGKAQLVALASVSASRSSLVAYTWNPGDDALEAHSLWTGGLALTKCTFDCRRTLMPILRVRARIASASPASPGGRSTSPS
jgi:hypothetical protein